MIKSTYVFSGNSISEESLFLERSHDGARESVARFAAGDASVCVRRRKVVEHLRFGDVEVQLTTELDVQTARHVRHNVVLKADAVPSQFCHCVKQ